MHCFCNVGDVNALIIQTKKKKKKEIKKEIVSLKDTIQQLDLIATYRIVHPKTEEYTLFSNAYGTIFRRDHMLGHKTSLNNFKRIKLISRISSDHTVRN